MTSARSTVLLKPVSPERPGITLDLVGDDQLAGGVGTWTTVDRPRRRAATEWAGTSGFSYVLPLLLNGMEQTTGRDTSIESTCRLLLDWASKPTKATDQPVVLTATGPLKAPARTRWVITSLDWGGVIRNVAGRRVQQYVTVTLTEYVPATVRRSPAKKSRDRKGKD